jgi:hypothetical protein
MITDLADVFAVPIALVLSTLASWVLGHAAVYLRERTHNELVARVVGGAGRLAANIHDTLACLPPAGHGDGQAVKAAMISGAVTMLHERMPETIEKLGVSDKTLAGIISGEFGKLAAVSTPRYAAAFTAAANNPR